MGVAVSGGALEELTLAHWDRVLDVNLRCVIHGVRAAYPRMLEKGDQVDVARVHTGREPQRDQRARQTPRRSAHRFDQCVAPAGLNWLMNACNVTTSKTRGYTSCLHC